MSKKIEKTKVEMTDAEKSACMDYLHGDVEGSHVGAAARYEYARESNLLCKAAEMFQSGKREYDLWLPLEEEADGEEWFLQGSWWAFYEFPSFPAKAWNQLSDSERKEFLRASGFLPPPNLIPPLWMTEVWQLEALGIFDEFKRMAAKQMEDKRKTAFQAPGSPPQPQPITWPVIEGRPAPISRLEKRLKRLQRLRRENQERPDIIQFRDDLKRRIEVQIKSQEESRQWVHTLFTIDFSKTKKRLAAEFKKWLELAENSARLERHKENPIGTTGGPKDRLKEIAAWRLYSTLGYEETQIFVLENQKSDKNGKPRRFHNPRKRKGRRKPSSGEDFLYRDEQGYFRATRGVEDYLAELIPWEFGKYAIEREEHRLAFLDQLQILREAS
jgi:hypothetical protein